MWIIGQKDTNGVSGSRGSTVPQVREETETNLLGRVAAGAGRRCEPRTRVGLGVDVERRTISGLRHNSTVTNNKCVHDCVTADPKKSLRRPALI
jgi:hypothetical protein